MPIYCSIKKPGWIHFSAEGGILRKILGTCFASCFFFDNSLKQIIFIGYNFNASLIYLTWQASMISLSKRYCSMVDMNSVLPYLTRNFSFSFNVVAGEFPGVLRKLSSSVSEKVGECERLSPRLLNVLVTDISSPTTRRLFASDGESRRLVPP